MPNYIKLKSLLQKEEAPEEGYWGHTGAGVIFMARDTGRFLFGLRSRDVNEPGTWGGFGGRVEDGETPLSAVKRESKEETGYDGPVSFRVLHVYKDENFRYYNYLGIIDTEFDPDLNWENDNYAWVEFGEWPDPLHFGAEAAIKASKHKIQQLLNINYGLEEAAMDVPPPAIVQQAPATNPYAIKVDVPSFSTNKVDVAGDAIPESVIEKLADAIWRIEGGSKTKYPYGIMSIDTGRDVKKARRICMNTIRNNYGRWIKAGKKGKYLDFLANVYCPASHDPNGNKNWKKNIRAVSGLDF